MASTNKTPNYDLPQWVASDPVEMADFNQAMSDIDSNLNLVLPVSGSNAYGSWIKYPDGTLECWGKDNLVYNAIRMLVCSKTFPVSFVGNVPSVNFEFIHGERTVASGTAWDGWVTGIQTLDLNSVEFRVWSVQTTNFSSGDMMPVVWRAIGRWK